MMRAPTRSLCASSRRHFKGVRCAARMMSPASIASSRRVSGCSLLGTPSSKTIFCGHIEMSNIRKLRPWTDVVRPHPDVASGDLAMGTYAANLAAVAYATGNAPSVYADAREFYASTFLTPAMRRVLSDVSSVLCGGPGDRALQLRTPFGGGKTHTLLALLHLARARAEVAKVTDLDGIPDPG